MTIVDVYDALTTARPYRGALTHGAAVQELIAGVAAGHYDPRFVEAFLDITPRPYVPFEGGETVLASRP